MRLILWASARHLKMQSHCTISIIKPLQDNFHLFFFMNSKNTNKSITKISPDKLLWIARLWCSQFSNVLCKKKFKMLREMLIAIKFLFSWFDISAFICRFFFFSRNEFDFCINYKEIYSARVCKISIWNVPTVC